MKYFLNLKKMQHFPLLVLAFFYYPQSIIGFYVYNKIYALLFFAIAFTSVLSYLFFFYIVFGGNYFSSFLSRFRNSLFDIGDYPFLVFGAYFIIIIYAVITTDEIALFIALKGASIDEIAKSREMFFRAREGWEAIINYVNALFVMAFLPYTIASLFYKKHKLRFYFLISLLFCLALTLEKSLAILAIVPIIILSINSGKNNKSLRIMIFLIIFIAGVSFLSRGGGQSDINLAPKTGGATSISDTYQLFKCDSQLCYIANRVIWIPYATAIDWLRYQHIVLDGDYVLGRSIGIVATSINVPKINLERAVFEFQWGQNETGTGSSNTVYFIDAFVNFSWLGVFLYAAILAIIVKILVLSDNVPVKCASFVSLFYLGFNSLPPMMFSGGLFVLIPIALFSRQKIKT